jgi:protein involved in polysaccharide export with SLBB domain
MTTQTFSTIIARRSIWVGSVVIALLVGCSKPKPQTLPAAFTDLDPSVKPAFQAITNQAEVLAVRPSSDLFTLGPGDRIDIEIIGKPGSQAGTFVGPDGKIYYNLLPGLDVWGLTLEQTRELLQRELGKYITSPEVAITLREVASRHVWLLGRFNRPGIYAMSAPMTVLQAIATAGGTARSASEVTTEELADLRHSFVMRNGHHLSVDFYRLLHDGDASQNIYLEPNDFVYLPSTVSQEVYVLGAVRTPRAVPYQEPMTVSSAIAGAEGPVFYEWLVASTGGRVTDAWLSHVAIVRGSLSQPEVAVIDYRAIMKSGAPDVRLEPGDIVYVPNSPYGTLKSYVNMVINTFVTTIAANEGLRAGGATNIVTVTAAASTPPPPPPPPPPR